ncbi:Unconventional prefoldin RPB5 interactor [Operophtera brumata]|uniref:Unconventional prefoldin RPB5 interactor n=1 Tax=Operophtera brumata TaxID=104452 RepID=A0A0L7KRP8_OPEBR|nr:Unconventional prefoldin RPB5 interactor [Operophtera brumata]
MSFINSLYQKSVADNQRNLHFWEDYLNNLRALNFSVYADKLKVPIIVPIGSRVFFRGELKHTNEVTVALGADYFVKCSLTQAEVLRQHRIKEKEYLENQISLTQHQLLEKEGQEILEVFTEDEDKAWRQKHKENVRKYKQGTSKEKEKPKEDITDEELWNRLEELELEEELENELLDNYNEISDKRKDNSFLVNEEQTKNDNEISDDIQHKNYDSTATIEDKMNILNNKAADTNEATKSKNDLLQQVLDKQNQLEEKLLELKNRDRQPSKTEKDLMLRLEEMEQLDELEDEMDRLDDDILETDSDDDETIVKTTPTILKKSISFADEVEDTSETVDITFKHSEVEPSRDPYDPEKGILKPSDIYEAHSQNLNSKPISILKKTKYDSNISEDVLTREQVNINLSVDSSEIELYPVKETIVVKDVIENLIDNQIKIDIDVRPTSLFKKRRMQNKS